MISYFLIHLNHNFLVIIKYLTHSDKQFSFNYQGIIKMTTLHYFVDPMCSWCYGFTSEMQKIISMLPTDITLRYVMGGLAPDSEEPMPQEMQNYIQNHWRTVAQRTGVIFNFDFWTNCIPKRSTYPACRAVIAASLQKETYKLRMLTAIQQAYYLQAKNPSVLETLIEIAVELGLNREQFANDLTSSHVEELLATDFKFKNNLGIQGFPALVLEEKDNYYALTIGYASSEIVLNRLNSIHPL